MGNITIELGGREYELKTPSIKRSREWRQAFRGSLEPVILRAQGVVQQLAGDVELISDDNQLNTELLNDALGTLLLADDVFDQMVDMVFMFSPVLAAEREVIEEEGTTEEAMAAFWQMLQAVYPFGSVIAKMRT